MSDASASSKPTYKPHLNGWLLCRVIAGPHRHKVGCVKQFPKEQKTCNVRFTELIFEKLPVEQVEVLCGAWSAREALRALDSETD